MDLPMKDIEIIVEAENAQKVLDALGAKGIKHKSVKDLEAIARMESTPKVEDGEGCCGDNEPESPSMLKKANNYRKTMTRWFKAGMPVVSLRVFAERLTVCGRCDSHKGYECTECGCPMDNKAKMNIDKLCELNKW
jgi:hypothetical protein